MPETKKTAPRPMIAARETGPGPGRYFLPSTTGTSNHDPTKTKSPASTFGTALPSTLISNAAGPGPAHAVPAGIMRTGTDSAPAFSMAGRAKDKKFGRTPAPGAYSPQNVKIDKGTIAPAYTMRPKCGRRKGEQTPASNAYNVGTYLTKSVNSTKKSSEQYSMTGRANKGGFAEDLSKAPGPGKYAVTDPNVNKNKQPTYSMRARTQVPQDATKKPGPGAHRPENVTANKPKAPAFSMGIRHSEYLTPLIVDVPDY